MKHTTKLTIVFAAVVLTASCKKTKVESKPIASLNVINAVISGGTVKVNINERDSAMTYNWKTFGIVPGADIKVYPTSSPSTPYYQSVKPETKNGKLYAAFLCGQLPNVETVFKEENVPAFYTDSIFGVRIINLSPNSLPVNVSLKSDPTVNVFTSIGYKQLSEIKTFPLPNITTSAADSTKRKTINFQIRNAAGTQFAFYELPVDVNSFYPGVSVNLQRYKNITIVIKGLQGTTSGPDAFGVFPVVMSY
jgi:hypothetical protein